jgi:hypothetical protein
MSWRHNTQHNDIQYNDTKHKGIFCDIQHNDVQQKALGITSL